jgi:hypothetical protein
MGSTINPSRCHLGKLTRHQLRARAILSCLIICITFLLSPSIPLWPMNIIIVLRADLLCLCVVCIYVVALFDLYPASFRSGVSNWYSSRSFRSDVWSSKPFRWHLPSHDVSLLTLPLRPRPLFPALSIFSLFSPLSFLGSQLFVLLLNSLTRICGQLCFVMFDS